MSVNVQAPESPGWIRRPAFMSYAVAVLAPTIALLIGWPLAGLYRFEPFVLFICAMLLSGWLGGMRPGLVAAVLSLVAFHYAFLVPIYPGGMSDELPRLLIAAATSGLVVWISASQREAVEALQESRQSLRHVIDTIPTMAWSLTPEGRVDFVNRFWLEYTGLTLETALEAPNQVVHQDDVARAVATWIENRAAARSFEDELRLRRADGQYRWFLVRTVPLKGKDGTVIKWYGTGTDIEERKRAEEALRAMSRQLVALQESERRRLASELHDRVGQTLTAIRIDLDMIRTRLDQHDDAVIRERADDALELIDSAFEAAEGVMYELRPPLIDEYGLLASLQWYARKFSERTGIDVEVRGAEQWRSTPELELTLFRIAQEALTNVAKHARARQVEIGLDYSDGYCTMSVRDDGVGFDSAFGGPHAGDAGLGMVTMRERSQAVGGQFEVRATPGKGTLLTVRAAC